MNIGKCIDCLGRGQVLKRPAPFPGPRCFTHNKATTATRSGARKAKHVETNFGITEDEYQLILKAQGGVCYICHRKPGRKRLCVDHDHNLDCGHDPKKGCRLCVRGLLHSKCNRFLGWLKDDPAAWERGADYIRNPPAWAVLRRRGESNAS